VVRVDVRKVFCFGTMMTEPWVSEFGKRLGSIPVGSRLLELRILNHAEKFAPVSDGPCIQGRGICAIHPMVIFHKIDC
jgi:hypothetical protein